MCHVNPWIFEVEIVCETQNCLTFSHKIVLLTQQRKKERGSVNKEVFVCMYDVQIARETCSGVVFFSFAPDIHEAIKSMRASLALPTHTRVPSIVTSFLLGWHM
jgi:hypothetical protein